MKRLFHKIDRFLLPDIPKFRYAPYVWLVYLSIFFTSLISFGQETVEYWYSAIGTLLFLGFYFHAYWSSPKSVRLDILAILIIGTFLAKITPGASVFFVYAGAFCCRLGSAKKAFAGIGLVVAWVFLVSVLLSLSAYFYVPAAMFAVIIGGVNIFEFEMTKKQQELILSQQEVRALAKTAERERIARDLHDLIGHTFSIITLKAELAGKLLDKNLDSARKEISELEDISRDALKQVREVVSGYRTSDLNTELAHAKYVLESNEISFHYGFDEFDIPETINKELAIIIKEFVTNIIKHANAEKVKANIYQEKDDVVLFFSDDGVGIDDAPRLGFGLKGIEERIEKLQGSLRLESEEGTTFTIRVPLEVC